MKTRINLYLDQLKPVKEPLPLNLTLYSWLSALVVVALSAGVLWGVTTNQISKKQQLSQQLTQQQSLLAAKIKQYSRKNTKDQLIKQRTDLLSMIAADDRVLAKINHQTLSNRQGFSELFTTFSQIKTDNIWLTNIHAQQAQLTVKGGAVHSNDIPRWLDRLRLYPELAGKDFSALQISREESYLQFSLENVMNMTKREESQ